MNNTEKFYAIECNGKYLTYESFPEKAAWFLTDSILDADRFAIPTKRHLAQGFWEGVLAMGVKVPTTAQINNFKWVQVELSWATTPIQEL